MLILKFSENEFEARRCFWNTCTKFLSENLNGRGHYKDIGTDCWIILELKGKRPLERHRHRWVGNIRIEREEATRKT